MKTKLSMVLIAFLFSNALFADEKSYTEAMVAALGQMKTTDPADYGQIANQFERIAQAEKTKWLPFYYASYVSVIQSYATQDKSKADIILDYAQKMLDQAVILNMDNSENLVMEGFIDCARIGVDPQRGAEYSQKAIVVFKKAQTIDPNNPRADYMLGMVLFNTPDFYGGGKKVAQPIFEGAILKYDKFVSLSLLNPSWGREDCQKQLDFCKQN
jgi:outer membrane PBP1 activator LpoA protein